MRTERLSEEIGTGHRVATLARRVISSHGQTLVEFALILPVLLLLLLGVLDFGRAVAANSSLAHAAREGARAGIYTNTSDSEILSAVRAQSGLATGLSDADIAISPAAPRHTGDRLTVTITYGFNAVTPMINSIWGGETLTMTSASTVRVE